MFDSNVSNYFPRAFSMHNLFFVNAFQLHLTVLFKPKKKLRKHSKKITSIKIRSKQADLDVILGGIKNLSFYC